MDILRLRAELWQSGVVLVSCRSHCDEFGQPDQVVGGDGIGEGCGDAGFASDFDAVVSGLGLDPAEHFLNAFAAAQAEDIAGVAGGPQDRHRRADHLPPRLCPQPALPQTH